MFEHILLNILENKRAKNLENSAKCAYKPIFSYSIKNSILPKMSLTTFLHSANDMIGGLHASLPNKNLQGNYFFKVFPHWCGRLYMRGGFFSLMQEILHAWRGKREKGGPGGRLPLNAGELDALQKLKGKNAIFKLNFSSLVYIPLPTFYRKSIIHFQ